MSQLEYTRKGDQDLPPQVQLPAPSATVGVELTLSGIGPSAGEDETPASLPSAKSSDLFAKA